MNKSLLSVAIILALLAYTKENTTETKPEQTVPASEFEALKQEVAELKSQIQNLTSGEQTQVVSVEDFSALKRENEELKAQISLFTSGFFEVDGLRFDRNGTLISVAKSTMRFPRKWVKRHSLRPEHTMLKVAWLRFTASILEGLLLMRVHRTIGRKFFTSIRA